MSLDGVHHQRSTAKVVLTLAKNIAELLEEVVQLLLLERREMLRHGRLMHWSGFGGRRWRIGDGHYLEDADILSGMQAKRLWAVIMDGYPQPEPLESAGTPVTNAGRGSSGQK